MPSSLLNALVERYLKEPRRPVQPTEYQKLVDGTVEIERQTKTFLKNRFPTVVGASFVRLAQGMGIVGRGKSKNINIQWAKNVTDLLSKISDTDQDDAMRKYSKIPSEIVSPSKIIPGCFYTYVYEAGTVDDYDLYPMMLCLSKSNKSVLGMNFHYLPYRERFFLFEAMMPLIAPIPVDRLTRIHATYKRLVGGHKYRGYNATIKRYNFSEFRTNAIFIAPVEWAVALAFPSHEFEGKEVNKVWTESLQKL